jgi:endonuclease-3
MARPRTPKGRAREVFDRLEEIYPGTAQELCELDFETPFQLAVATILSAQTTDARVNMVTPVLFSKWPDAAALASADTIEVEEVLRSTGFFRQKTKSVQGFARLLLEEHGGEVPTEMADLVKLPGIGRKTANVIRSVGFGLPGLPVDTHVLRLSVRLGLTEETDPVKVEHALGALLPGSQWGLLSERVILHGRRVCDARKPRCDDCVLNDFCPSAFIAGRR